MTQDARWRIGDAVADGLLSNPTWAVGNSETLEVFVAEETNDGRPLPERSYEATLGGGAPATMGGKAPGTVGAGTFETLHGAVDRADAYLDPNESPYGKLREYIRHAGTATVEQSVDGIPLVRENVPARSSLDSFIVDVEPIGDDVHWGEGAWVLVTDASDISTIVDVDANLAVSLEVVVLASLTDYQTRAELEAELAPPVTT